LILTQFVFRPCPAGIIRGFGNRVIEKRIGIECIIATEPERRAVQIIRARLADDVDLIGAEAVFR
jgi:hypothetical protein